MQYIRYKQLLQKVRDVMKSRYCRKYREVADKVFPELRKVSRHSWVQKAIDGTLETPDPNRIERLAAHLEIVEFADDEEQAAA